MEKEFYVIHLPQLDKMPLKDVGQYLDANVEHQIIDSVNWQESFPYKPYSTFVVAVSDTRLYVFFSVISKDLRAVNTTDLNPVADDSCVEFFMQIPCEEEYWNFEFNCIGTLNGSHRVKRNEPTRLTSEQLSSIKRYASCGNEAIEEQDGTFCWDLTVSIPLDLVGLEANNLPSFIKGNFYKCSGKSKHRHYVSWNPIADEKPNFHRPDCFGKIWFELPEPEEPATINPPVSTTKNKGIKRLIHKWFSRKS